MHYPRILLASHDTPGAQAAEQMALSVASKGQTVIEHLVVVPDFWRGMTGDDWLNNSATQAEYGSYVENELEREIRRHADRLTPLMAEADLDYGCTVVYGRPDRVLIKTVSQGAYDLVVMGSRRPKGVDGLRSRMLTEALFSQLHTALLIAPYPVADE